MILRQSIMVLKSARGATTMHLVRVLFWLRRKIAKFKRDILDNEITTSCMRNSSPKDSLWALIWLRNNFERDLSCPFLTKIRQWRYLSDDFIKKNMIWGVKLRLRYTYLSYLTPIRQFNQFVNEVLSKKKKSLCKRDLL